MSTPRPVPEPASDQDVSRLLRLAGPRPGPPPDVSARVRAAAWTAWRREVAARRRRRYLWAAAGVAVALAAIALGRPAPHPPSAPAPASPVIVLARVTGGGVHRVEPQGAAVPLRSGDGLPVGAWLETARDGRAAWRMGGASVRQDTETRLQVLGPSAVWLERGGLYVDSGASGSAPIEVATAEGRVRELGTQFEVRRSAQGVRVRVREGSVVLLRGDNGHEARAGQGLDVGTGPLVRRTVPLHGPGWSWVEEVAPEFPLEGQTLQSLVAWTARETGWSIRFSRPADARRAGRMTLHGSAAGLAPSQALPTVLPTCGLAWRRQGGTAWIDPAAGEP
jgi:ferric-dicitrate binding protein FerR (iron transport regulator)